MEKIENLQEENKKLQKRLDRIISKADREQLQLQKLNVTLENYVSIIDDYIITLTISRDYKITAVSTAFSRVFGYKQKEIVGQDFSFILPGEELDQIHAILDETRKNQLIWHGDLKLRSKSEAFVITDTVINPVIEEGEVTELTLISKDITDRKKVEELNIKMLAQNKKHDNALLEFMSSISAATLQKTSPSLKWVLWAVAAFVAWFLIWSNITELDEVTRGSGKIIPSSQIQVVQNLEGGIVSEILVQEGQEVRAEQLLIRMHNVEYQTKLEENNHRMLELMAKSARLEAIANNAAITENETVQKLEPQLMDAEKSLFFADKEKQESIIRGLEEKRIQRKNELEEAREKYKRLTENFKLIKEELRIKEVLVKDRVVSKVELSQLQREANDLELEMNTVRISIPRYESAIEEIAQNIEESRLRFQNDARLELNQVMAEVARLKESGESLKDRLERSFVKSPVNGTINQIHVNTIGGVVQPGRDLVEIVPSQDSLLAEVRIPPADIAFLHTGQDAMIKFSAYDFAVHGGAKGKLSYISSDTVPDEEGKSHYIVHIETDKNHLGSEQKPLKIKVGMVVDVDILTGKKTVMDYMLKPILKAQQTALREK